MNPYGTVIEGEIRQGFGAASRVVPRLAPHLKPYFSAIDDLHPATINVFLLYKPSPSGCLTSSHPRLSGSKVNLNALH